ncbi:DNA-binding transcriptional regulator, LysR family [Cohaesibacter gelatinilyticus]|uniref:DNA-binding transcriptional regulator, LysR family n=2 Tax=Cohaesibacter gelatinilyticus TaxID=372072 RepID=A0A285PGW2_9HYPH|nr:DNA-binding transcriptional regulator, LysR family [Cohaesibacter gelatinilyticus]
MNFSEAKACHSPEKHMDLVLFVRYNRTMIDMFSPQIRTFLAVAEAGSITAAADRLGMAKSSISHHLSSLEASLGISLIHRTTRRMALTHKGSLLLEHTQAMRSIADTALKQVRASETVPTGPIRLTAPHAMITDIIAPAIQRLLLRYPGLEPFLINDDKRLDLLDEKLDMSITVGELPDSDFRAQRVGTLNDVLCATPDLLEGADLKVSSNATSLALTLPYIAHARQTSIPKHQLYHVTSQHEIEITCHPTVTVNTVEAIAALTRIGMGVAVLPDFVVKADLQHGRLVSVLPEYSFASKPVFAVHPYKGKPPKSVRELIAEIKNSFKS